MKFRIFGLLGIAAFFTAVTPGQSRAATLTTLVSFNGTDGGYPYAGLIADANGDLFGTTFGSGAYGNYGTVFEIAKTAGGYASTPTTLVSFNDIDGARPRAGLIADANGNLFGTTEFGGVSSNCSLSRLWHGIRGRQNRRRLYQYPHHPGQPQRHQWRADVRRPDRRCERQSLRHDSIWRGVWIRPANSVRIWHGVRDRQ
jgi:hypothetical protein